MDNLLNNIKLMIGKYKVKNIIANHCPNAHYKIVPLNLVMPE